MPVPTDNIEEEIEKVSFILDNYEQLCLVDRERVNLCLHIISNNLVELLDQKMPLLIEYFDPISQLIRRFDKVKIVIPQELNDTLCDILLTFDDNDDFEVLQEIVNYYIEILDILGVDA